MADTEKQIDKILLGGGGHTWQRREIMKLIAKERKEAAVEELLNMLGDDHTWGNKIKFIEARLAQLQPTNQEGGKVMTNYNERLDEVLANLGERHIMVEHRLIHLGMPEQNGKNIETSKAKQAITSLIKELVAEAKPENPYPYITNSRAWRQNHIGFNEAIDKFEQNLLKALGEK